VHAQPHLTERRTNWVRGRHHGRAERRSTAWRTAQIGGACLEEFHWTSRGSAPSRADPQARSTAAGVGQPAGASGAGGLSHPPIGPDISRTVDQMPPLRRVRDRCTLEAEPKRGQAGGTEKVLQNGPWASDQQAALWVEVLS
jgi:hypothetical protein